MEAKNRCLALCGAEQAGSRVRHRECVCGGGGYPICLRLSRSLSQRMHFGMDLNPVIKHPIQCVPYLCFLLLTPIRWENKNESVEQINSISETNVCFDSCNQFNDLLIVRYAAYRASVIRLGLRLLSCRGHKYVSCGLPGRGADAGGRGMVGRHCGEYRSRCHSAIQSWVNNKEFAVTSVYMVTWVKTSFSIHLSFICFKLSLVFAHVTAGLLTDASQTQCCAHSYFTSGLTTCYRIYW